MINFRERRPNCFKSPTRFLSQVIARTLFEYILAWGFEQIERQLFDNLLIFAIIIWIFFFSKPIKLACNCLIKCYLELFES